MTPIVADHSTSPAHLAHSQSRWSAIFAGIVVALALLCFLHLFGLAIGVSIVDLSDARAIGTGLGVGVIIWSVLSWLIALFLGSMHTARLSGEGNETVGLLNGVTVWAATSILVTVLGLTGFGSLAGSAFSAAGTVVSSSASALGSAASATGGAIGSAVTELSETDTAAADEVTALLKQGASQAMAGDAGEEGPSPKEVRVAIEQLDAETLTAFAGRIAAGDTNAAAESLADDVSLSRQDLRDLVERASVQIQQMLGTAGNEKLLSQDVLNEVKSALAARLEGLDKPGGTAVAQSDIRAALDDLDAEVMQNIAFRLVQGDADGARNTLVANTSLTRQEADELLAGVETDLHKMIDRFSNEMKHYADEAGDYAQTVLWVAFVIATLSLGASALGGWIGTRPIRVWREPVSPTTV